MRHRHRIDRGPTQGREGSSRNVVTRSESEVFGIDWCCFGSRALCVTHPVPFRTARTRDSEHVVDDALGRAEHTQTAHRGQVITAGVGVTAPATPVPAGHCRPPDGGAHTYPCPSALARRTSDMANGNRPPGVRATVSQSTPSGARFSGKNNRGQGIDKTKATM